MTEGTTLGKETYIKIDGVEYGMCPYQSTERRCACPNIGRCPDVHFQVGQTCYAPKRVQTDWICRVCEHRCVSQCAGSIPTTFRCMNRNVVPFYGKVDEESRS